jgi:hypothetical protein
MIAVNTVLILIAVSSFVASKSVIDINEVQNNEIHDSNFPQTLEKAYTFFEDYINGKIPKDRFDVLVSSLLKIFKRSIDVKCAEEKFERFGWKTKFNKFLNQVDDLSESERAEVVVMYVEIGSLCSNKLGAIENFFFDALMALGHIVRAFKDEPELDEFTFYLRCLNKFAIDKKYWDFDDYELNTNLNEIETLQCEGLTSNLEEIVRDKFLKGIKPTNGEDEVEFVECHKKSFEDSMKLSFKYILLTQVELTSEEKEAERTKFSKANRKLYEESLQCGINEKIHGLDFNMNESE